MFVGVFQCVCASVCLFLYVPVDLTPTSTLLLSFFLFLDGPYSDPHLLWRVFSVSLSLPQSLSLSLCISTASSFLYSPFGTLCVYFFLARSLSRFALFLFLSLSLSHTHTFSLSLFLPLFFSAPLFFSVSFLFFVLSFCLCVRVYDVCLSVCVCLSAILQVCLLVCLFVCGSVGLSAPVSLSVPLLLSLSAVFLVHSCAYGCAWRACVRVLAGRVAARGKG